MERFCGKEPGPCEVGSGSSRKTGIAGDDDVNSERRRWREDFMRVGDLGWSLPDEKFGFVGSGVSCSKVRP